MRRPTDEVLREALRGARDAPRRARAGAGRCRGWTSHARRCGLRCARGDIVSQPMRRANDRLRLSRGAVGYRENCRFHRPGQSRTGASVHPRTAGRMRRPRGKKAVDSAMLPDVMVHCGPLPSGATSMNDPTVLVEVMSEGSKARDRFEKWAVYQKLSSLRHYVLVERDRAHIETFDCAHPRRARGDARSPARRNLSRRDLGLSPHRAPTRRRSSIETHTLGSSCDWRLTKR